MVCFLCVERSETKAGQSLPGTSRLKQRSKPAVMGAMFRDPDPYLTKVGVLEYLDQLLIRMQTWLRLKVCVWW